MSSCVTRLSSWYRTRQHKLEQEAQRLRVLYSGIQTDRRKFCYIACSFRNLPNSCLRGVSRRLAPICCISTQPREFSELQKIRPSPYASASSWSSGASAPRTKASRPRSHRCCPRIRASMETPNVGLRKCTQFCTKRPAEHYSAEITSLWQVIEC